MKFLEKDLEQIIYDADKELLAEKGLIIEGKIKRQLRIGNYGIADLVEFKRPYYCNYFKRMLKGEIIVYELKQEKIGISAFLQALGYLKGIKTYLQRKGSAKYYNYSITLIGKSIDINSTYTYLTDFIGEIDEFKEIYEGPMFSVHNYTYSYDLDGISFTREQNYNLTNPGF